MTDASDVSHQQNAVSRKRLDEWLDDALADTFPASDPVASPPADAALVERHRAAQNQSPAAPSTSGRSRR